MSHTPGSVLSRRRDSTMDSASFQSAPPPNLLLVISGSSGAGKDTVIERMKQLRLPLADVVTATTRQQRPSEIDGIHYIF